MGRVFGANSSVDSPCVFAPKFPVFTMFPRGILCLLFLLPRAFPHAFSEAIRPAQSASPRFTNLSPAPLSHLRSPDKSPENVRAPVSGAKSPTTPALATCEQPGACRRCVSSGGAGVVGVDPSLRQEAGASPTQEFPQEIALFLAHPVHRVRIGLYTPNVQANG